MRCLITGVAGFIGSNLAEYLLSKKHYVIGVDNFSTGNTIFLKYFYNNNLFELHNLDISNFENFLKISKDVDIIFHLSAKADIRNNKNERHIIYNENIRNTFLVLEACVKNKIPKIVFPSTCSIYGDTKQIPTPENFSLVNQTSIYSASKLASEALIESYCNTFDLQGYIYRLVSVLGKNYHHGHLIDFYKQLLKDSSRLIVLGDGNQRKSYINVYDVITGMMYGLESYNKVNIFNLATDETTTVNENISWMLEELKLNPIIEYTNEKSWIGDNEYIYPDTKKIRNMGWRPCYTIKESVIDTVRYIGIYYGN